MRGRSRIPDEVKQARGNPGKKKLKEQLAKRIPGIPIRPDIIKGHALFFWAHVEEILKKQGRWSADMQPALVALCQSYGEREALRLFLEKLGDDRFEYRETKGGDSYHSAHPAIAAYQNADARFMRWLNEFGLTDASRSKVTPGDGGAPDEGAPEAEFNLH